MPVIPALGRLRITINSRIAWANIEVKASLGYSVILSLKGRERGEKGRRKGKEASVDGRMNALPKDIQILGNKA